MKWVEYIESCIDRWSLFWYYISNMDSILTDGRVLGILFKKQFLK